MEELFVLWTGLCNQLQKRASGRSDSNNLLSRIATAHNLAFILSHLSLEIWRSRNGSPAISNGTQGSATATNLAGLVLDALCQR